MKNGKAMGLGIVAGFISTLLMVCFNNCVRTTTVPTSPSTTKGTEVGNPMRSTNMAVAPYSTDATTQGKTQLKSLSVCKSQLILKGPNPVMPAQTVSFDDFREQTIPADGIDLEALKIPPGQYTQITMVLADACGMGRSLNVTNSSGHFQTSQSISLQFQGNIVLDGSTQKIVFEVQPIIDNLSLASANNQLVTQAQAASGSYKFPACTSDYAAAVLADNPKGYWRLNETSGSIAYDLGYGGNNPGYFSGAILGQPAPFPGTGNFSASSPPYDWSLAHGVAYNFTDLGGTNNMTIEFWAKTDDLVSNGAFGFNASGNGGAYAFLLGGDCDANQFRVHKGTTTLCIDGYVRDANWHHYAMVANASGIKIYVDGSVAGTSADAQNFSNCGSWCMLQFGNQSTSMSWQAETAIYPTALSAARIQAHYDASSSCR